MDTLVYMDHNATTALRPGAGAAMTAAMAAVGNPSSVHAAGRRARKVIEDARDAVAALAGAPAADVIFTSGGTEANALALRGCGRPRVLASRVEHVSVLHARDDIELIPVDANGVVDVAALARMLGADDAPALVSVMAANNETGVCQPVSEVAAVARQFGALVHCDAVQAAGKIDIDVGAMGVDLLSLSAHKIGGPTGSGALIVAGTVAMSAQSRGGGQERGARAGTENVTGIAGFGAAAFAAKAGLADSARLARLRDRIERALGRLGARVLGAGADRLANTSCLVMPGVAADIQLIRFDLAGIAVSTGAACSSGKVEPSHVLAAMGVEPEQTRAAIRVSLGWNSSEGDADRFVAAWAEIFARGQGVERAAGSAAA